MYVISVAGWVCHTPWLISECTQETSSETVISFLLENTWLWNVYENSYGTLVQWRPSIFGAGISLTAWRKWKVVETVQQAGDKASHKSLVQYRIGLGSSEIFHYHTCSWKRSRSRYSWLMRPSLEEECSHMIQVHGSHWKKWWREITLSMDRGRRTYRKLCSWFRKCISSSPFYPSLHI